MRFQHPVQRHPLLPAIALAMTGVASASATSEQQIEEITVVAQPVGGLRLDADTAAGSRLGLSALETPASVDLITAAEIAARGDYAAHDAITRSAGISSVATPGNGGSAVSSRGFTGNVATAFTYDGTRLYVTAGTVTFPADTWTLERVEILRGAGSVIHGFGAIGTTINYVPKTPDPESADFEALVAAGRFGTARIAVGGGAPLNEAWSFRVDATHYRSDGFADRADEQRNVFAGSVLYQPTDDLSVRFSLDYADIEAAPFWGTPLVDGQADRALRRNNYNFGDAFIEYRDLWARVRTEWRFAQNATLRNDTYLLDAEREWQNLEGYAFNAESGLIDRSSYLGIVHDTRQYGTRTDVLLEGGIAGRTNRFTVGGEVNVIDLDYDANFASGGFGVSDSVPVFGFEPGRLPRDEVPTLPNFVTDNTQYAVFFDNVLDLTEQLSLVAGGRYDRFEFERDELAIDDPRATPRAASSFDTNLSKFTWRAGLVFRPLDTLSLYAQTSTAADPVTSPVTISAGLANFDLTTGRQYEVGLKHQLLNGRAEYTLAWFDITKRNLVTRAPGAAFSEQIGQQSAEGLEITFRVNPTDRISLDLNAAFINAQYDEFFIGEASLRGNTPRNVPERTANAWGQWSPVERWQLGLGLRYVGSRYANDTNTFELPSYTVLDVAVTWQTTDQLSLTLRGRNLGDRDYVTAQYISAEQWLFGDPRSWELSARYAF